MRCQACGWGRPDEIPYEPVKVIEVVSRNTDGTPDQYLEYFLASRTAGSDRQREPGLGEPAAPGSVPESLGESPQGDAGICWDGSRHALKAVEVTMPDCLLSYNPATGILYVRTDRNPETPVPFGWHVTRVRDGIAAITETGATAG